MLAETTPSEAFEVPRIPIGDVFDRGVTWLTNNAQGFFDSIQHLVQAAVTVLLDVLTWPPALVTVAILALFAFAARGWRFALFSVLALTLIVSMHQWPNTMSSLALILVASVIAIVIAIPLGVLAARSDMASRIITPILDFMQTMPAFVYLIPAVTFFSVGVVPGIIATVIFSMPPGVRLTELGIRGVDPELVEAGYAFGATPRAVLGGIQIPLALRSIMAGVNQVIMLALSMVVIAGMVGAGGLGGAVFESITRLDMALGFEAGLAVVIIAIYLDRLTGAVGSSSRKASTN
ncbi:ABC transporter permease [Gephyromycinifex aptenodytis]|uniref:ABC transporter permease n=1 Tax=Gephyromycinifex aptenodytis TaxID=2716227 RepID=UPI0014473548|nr:ABC transporter permease subunit [Gephyromycinifex aptenodytis]